MGKLNWMRNGIVFMSILLFSAIKMVGQSGSVSDSWRSTLLTPGGELPFKIKLPSGGSGLPGGEIMNGNEVINFKVGYTPLLDTATWEEYVSPDSFTMFFPVFKSEIKVKYSEEKNTLTGFWRDYSRSGVYYLPFKAEKHKDFRFVENPLPPKSNISGKWDAVFKDESSTDSTVGIFEQNGNHLTGTFLTTTGDYRFLEGDVSADSFYLSAFDGSHAFLFKGKIHDDGTLSGGFWSGKHYHATFTATKNANAKLPDPKSLTYLKDGYSKIDFSFPDENGNMVSLNDEEFKNKVIIIQITGSWCPNCMDETSYMSELEEKYKNADVAFIALSFERQPDSINFKNNITRLKQHFGVEYAFLNAGLPKTASDAMPMLNRVMGFPTTIILNKDHEVVEIYTGFNGPATGDLFVQYQKNFEELINQLLK